MKFDIDKRFDSFNNIYFCQIWDLSAEKLFFFFFDIWDNLLSDAEH